MGRLLTSEIEALIGQTVTYTAPEELGRASIRYFAMAIGDDNPLYTDPEFAREHGYDDVIAPPTMVCETAQQMTGSPDADGYLGHTWKIEVPGTRLIRGANEYEFARPVYPSDVITATWTVSGIEERTSSSGAALLLVTSEARYTNQMGDLLAVNREITIHQEM